jgi:hypothetical protein
MCGAELQVGPLWGILGIELTRLFSVALLFFEYLFFPFLLRDNDGGQIRPGLVNGPFRTEEHSTRGWI